MTGFYPEVAPDHSGLPGTIFPPLPHVPGACVPGEGQSDQPQRVQGRLGWGLCYLLWLDG